MKSGRLALFPIILLFSLFCFGQVSADLDQGMKPYGSYHGGDLDHISMSNGNLFFQANLLTYSQRGGELAYPIVLQYNNENFTQFKQCDPGQPLSQCIITIDFGPPTYTLNNSSPGNAVWIGYEGVPGAVDNAPDTGFNTGLVYYGSPIYVQTSSVLTPDGSLHQLVNTNNGKVTTDGSGFLLDSGGTLHDRNGTKFFSNGMIEDANGNKLDPFTATNTLGRHIPPMPGPAYPAATPPAGSASLTTCPALNYSHQPVTYAYTWNLPTVNGGSLPLTLCYASVYVRTGFFVGSNPNWHDLSQGFTMLQSVVFPDNTYWAFEYDAADPNNTSSVAYADLLKITFPTGGSLSYTWGPCPNCSMSFTSRSVVTRSVDANDGNGSHTWNYNLSGGGGIVTDPSGNDTVHALTALGGKIQSLYETQTQYFQGSHTNGTLLKTVQTDYQFTDNPWDSSAVSGGISQSVTNVFPIRLTTTLANGLVSKTETDYDSALAYHGPLDGITFNNESCYTDAGGFQQCGWSNPSTMPVTNYTGSYGKVIATREYDWGQGAPGPLLRQTLTNYLWQSNSSYLTYDFLDLVSSSTVQDGSGNQVAKTTYGYDEYSLNSSGVTTQFNSSPVNGSVRGNQTSVHHWLNGSTTSTPNCSISVSNGYLVTYAQYNDTGTVYQTTDACGSAAGDANHRTIHTYDLAYAGAYSTKTCNPLGQCVSGTYDFNTGLLTSFTDANASYQASGTTPGDPAHTTNYAYDSRWRLTSATLPADPSGNHPQTTFNYPNATTVERLKKISSTLTDDLFSYFDGLGRPYRSVHASAGNATVVTNYDAVGRVVSVTNPYFTTSDPTYGTIQTQYDALGRVTQTTKQDGSMSLAQYDVASGNTNCAVTTDEAGNQRRSCSDGLGRLVEVDEPQANSAGTSATASVTISGELQVVAVSGGSIPLAASGSPLTSFLWSGSNSPQNVFYLSSDRHVHRAYANPNGVWYDEDCTALSGAPVAAAGTALTSYLSSGTGFPLAVIYLTADQHVHQLYADGNGVWQDQDNTAFAGGPAAASSSALTSFFWASSGYPQNAIYLTPDGHVHQLYASTGGIWRDQDNTAFAGGPPAASGSALTSFLWAGSSGPQDIFYLAGNQHVHHLYADSNGVWHDQDDTALAGSPAAAVGSALTSFLWASGAAPENVLYFTTDHHLHQFWMDSGGTWHDQDNTAFAGAPAAAAGSALTSYLWPGTGDPQNVFYLTPDQHVHAMYADSNGIWHDQDNTAFAGAPAATSGSALSSYLWTGSAAPQNVFYETSDRHIHQLYAVSSGVWHDWDISGTAGSTMEDSGTVSLTLGEFTATACFGNSSSTACVGKPVNDTPTEVAVALAQAINVASSPATATVSGATLSLTWKTPGPFTPPVAAMSTTHDCPSQFPNPSFTSPAMNFANGTGNLGSSPYVTVYSYDMLGNLLRVDQKGTAPSDSRQWRTRLFTYDSLSRLLTANNPESGTISYGYDADGNVLQKTSPAPNQTGTATQTISYCYDKLNRITGKQYAATSCPLSSPVGTYAYDAGTNGLGHLTSLTDQAGSGSYSFDALGRMTSEQRTIAGIQKSLSYAYYLDSSINTLTYPSGAVVTYTPDAAGRMLSAVDNGNNIQYVTSATYGPDSSLTGFVSGHSSTFSGITSSFSYNRRLQPTLMSATAPNQTVFSIGYDFHYGLGDNGNVFSLINYRDSSRTQTFTYDALNRLTSAQNTGTDCTKKTANNLTEYWGNSYTYDAWGNLTGKTPTKCSAESLNEYADWTNRLHTYSGVDNWYDAAGNMTHDATTGLNYSYDAENRITGAGGYTYTYDDDGNRVEKSSGSTGTIYWYMSPGIVGESDLSGNLISEYVFFGNGRVARKDFSGSTISYYFSDDLNTARVIADVAGSIKEDEDFYPFGGELQIVDNDPNKYKFDGDERDSETGLDNMGHRYYSSQISRFVTPDMPGLDQYRINPQTWNLYTFGRNSPLTFADPTGNYVCGSSVSAAQCSDFQKGLDNAQKAANSLKDKYGVDSDQYKDAQRAIDAYGKAGVDNGVTVQVGATQDPGTRADVRVANTTGPKTADNPTGQKITVTFNADYVGNAAVEAHEGSHVADGSAWVASGFSPAMNPTRYATEFRAYSVQANILNTEMCPGCAVSLLAGGRQYPFTSPIWSDSTVHDFINDYLAIPKSQGGLYEVTPTSKVKAYRQPKKPK